MANQWPSSETDRKMESMVPLTIEPLKPGEVFTLPDGQRIPLDGVGPGSTEPNNNSNPDVVEPEPLVIIPDDDDDRQTSQVDDRQDSQVDTKANILSQTDSKANVLKAVTKKEIGISQSTKQGRTPPVVYEVLDSDEETETQANAVSNNSERTTVKKPIERSIEAGPAQFANTGTTSAKGSTVSHTAPVNTSTPSANKSNPSVHASTSSASKTPLVNKTKQQATSSTGMKGKQGSSFSCPIPECNKKLFSTKMEAFVHWNMNHDFNAICFTCRDCTSVKSWPREPFIGHINQAHKRAYTAILDQIDKKFINPKEIEPPDDYDNWCNEKIYPKRSGHINVVWKPQGIKCPVTKCTSKDNAFTDPQVFFEHWKLVHRVETDHFVCKLCSRGVVFQTKYKETLLKHIEKAHLRGKPDGNMDDHYLIEISRNLEYIDPYPYTMKKNDKLVIINSKDSPKKEVWSKDVNSSSTTSESTSSTASGKDVETKTSCNVKSYSSNSENNPKSPTLSEKPRITYRTIRKAPEASASVSDINKECSSPFDSPSVVPNRACTPSDIFLNTETKQYIQWTSSGVRCPVETCRNRQIDFKRDVIKHWQEFHTGSAVVYDCPACLPGQQYSSHRLGQLYSHIREAHVKDMPEKQRDREKNRILTKVKLKENQNVEFTDPAPYQLLITDESLKDPRVRDTLKCPAYNCEVAVTSYDKLTAHWKVKHVPTIVAFPCPMCGKPLKCSSSLKTHMESYCCIRGIYSPADVPSMVENIKETLLQNEEFLHPGKFTCVGEVLQAINKAISETKANEALHQENSGVKFYWSLKNKTNGDVGLEITGKMVSSYDEKSTFTFKEDMQCPVKNCTAKLVSVGTLREHWIEKHVPFSIHYDCPIADKCKEKFKGSSGLEAHLKYSHNCGWTGISLNEFIRKSKAQYIANDSFVEPDVFPPTDIVAHELEDQNDNQSDNDDDDDDTVCDDYAPSDDDDDSDSTWKPAFKSDCGDGPSYVTRSSRSHVFEWKESVNCPVNNCGEYLNSKLEAIRHWRQYHISVFKQIQCPLCEISDLYKGRDRETLSKHIKVSHSRSFKLSGSQVDDLVETAVVEEVPNTQFKDPENWTFPESEAAAVKQKLAKVLSLRSSKDRRSNDSDSGSPPAKRVCREGSTTSPIPAPATTPTVTPAKAPTSAPAVKQEPVDDINERPKNNVQATPSPSTRSAPPNYKMATLEKLLFKPGCCPVWDCKCTRNFTWFKDFETHWELVHLEECEQYLCPLCPPDCPTQFREKLFLKDFQVHLRCKKHFGKPVTKSTLMSLVRKMKRMMLPNRNYVVPWVPKDRVTDKASNPSLPNGAMTSSPVAASTRSATPLSRTTTPTSSASAVSRSSNSTPLSTDTVKQEPADAGTSLPFSASPKTNQVSPARNTRLSQESRTPEKEPVNSSPVPPIVQPTVTKPANRTARKRTAPVAASSASKPAALPAPTTVKHTAKKSTAKPHVKAAQNPTDSPAPPKTVKVGHTVLKAPVDNEPVPAGYRILTDEEGVELPVGVCPIKDCQENVTENFRRHWEIFHKPSSLYICCPLCPAHSRFSIRSTVDINSLSRHITSTHETSESPPTLVRDTLSKVLRVMMKNPKYNRPLVLEKDFPVKHHKSQPAAKTPQVKASNTSASSTTPKAASTTNKTAKASPAISAKPVKSTAKSAVATAETSNEKTNEIESTVTASTSIEDIQKPVSEFYPNLVGYERIVERNGRKYYLVRKEDIIFVEGEACPIMHCGKVVKYPTGTKMHWLYKHEKIKTMYKCSMCPKGNKEFSLMVSNDDRLMSHYKYRHSIKGATAKKLMKKLKGQQILNPSYMEPLVPINPFEVVPEIETRGGQKRKLGGEEPSDEKKVNNSPGRTHKKVKLTAQRESTPEKKKKSAKNETAEGKKEKSTEENQSKSEKEGKQDGGKKPEKGKPGRKPKKKGVEKAAEKAVENEKVGTTAAAVPADKGKEAAPVQEKRNVTPKEKFAEMIVLHKMTTEEIKQTQDKLKNKEKVEPIDAIPGVSKEVLEFDPLKNMPRSAAGLKAYRDWLKKMQNAVTIAGNRLKLWKDNAKKQEQKYMDGSVSPSGMMNLYLVSGDTPICEITFDSPTRRVTQNSYEFSCSKTQEKIQIETISSNNSTTPVSKFGKKPPLPKLNLSGDSCEMPTLSVEGTSTKQSSSSGQMPALPFKGHSKDVPDNLAELSVKTEMESPKKITGNKSKDLEAEIEGDALQPPQASAPAASALAAADMTNRSEMVENQTETTESTHTAKHDKDSSIENSSIENSSVEPMETCSSVTNDSDAVTNSSDTIEPMDTCSSEAGQSNDDTESKKQTPERESFSSHSCVKDDNNGTDTKITSTKYLDAEQKEAITGNECNTSATPEETVKSPMQDVSLSKSCNLPPETSSLTESLSDTQSTGNLSNGEQESVSLMSSKATEGDKNSGTIHESKETSSSSSKLTSLQNREELITAVNSNSDHAIENDSSDPTSVSIDSDATTENSNSEHPTSEKNSTAVSSDPTNENSGTDLTTKNNSNIENIPTAQKNNSDLKAENSNSNPTFNKTETDQPKGSVSSVQNDTEACTCPTQ